MLNYSVISLWAGLAMPLTYSLAAQPTPLGEAWLCRAPEKDAQFSVAPATGALTWALPVGRVPGDIPIPVVFRYQASMTSLCGKATTPAQADSTAARNPFERRTRGIWGSLNFGYITPPTQDSACGLAEEGTQVLEDGTLFHDRDWNERVADGSLPLAFGFQAPAEGYARDASRTYGRYSPTLAELGDWRSRIAQLTSMSRFQVLLDCDRARVYAYHDALHAFVPVLWVDRFGHWVGFRWQQSAWSGGDAFTVQVTNAAGKGIQVAWAPQSGSTGVVDLLRADFIGIPAPSLLVRGYSGLPSQLPASVEAPPLLSTAMAVGGLVGRPTRIQWGAPGSLPVPAFVPSLPEAPASAPVPVREWLFSYSDESAAELSSLRDPMGLKTTFTFQSYRFPDNLVLRGVQEITREDLATGVTHTRTWAREMPATMGAPWTVSQTSRFSEGQETERRTLVNTYLDTGSGPMNAFLQSVQIRGAAGTTQTTTYAPSPGPGATPAAADEVHFTGTGKPSFDLLRTIDPATGDVTNETLAVNGEPVQTRSFTYCTPFQPLGPHLPRAVTVKRQGLPSVMERCEYSGQGQLTRQALLAGGQARGNRYTFDAEGRLASLGLEASWAADPGPLRTYTPSPLGPLALSTTGTRLDQPLRETWGYDETGQVARYTDPQGNTTVTTFDLWGRPLTVSSTGSPTLTLAYPDERTRTWRQGRLEGSERLDGFGRLQATVRPDRVTESYGTDVLGRRVLVKESNGRVTRTAQARTYDALDRILTEQTATGLPRSYEYASSGIHQVVTIRTPNGDSSVQKLDPWGQVVSFADSTSSTQTTFNEFGQATRVLQEDATGKSQVRSFDFDGIGKLIRLTTPETQSTALAEFNALAQPGRVTDASGRTIRRTYDALGRLLTVSNGSLNLAMAYQGPFLMGRSSSDGVSQAFTYGAPGHRLDRESLTLAGVKRTIGYGYDSDGALSRMIYPSGRIVDYGYDSLSRIHQVTQNGSPLAGVDYDDWGHSAGLRFQSGAQSAWDTDDQGRPQTWKLTHAAGSERRNHQYDAAGHLILAGEWELRHDARGRLTQASGFGLKTEHGYDGFANNIRHTLSGTLPHGFNAFHMETLTDNRIPGIQANGGLTGWVVEANGEAAQIGTGVASQRTLGLGWDGLGRLAAVSDSLTGGVQRYRYAPSGMRVGLTDSLDAQRDRQFLASDAGLLLGEYLGDGSWKRDVIYLGSQALAEVDDQGVHELHADHLGTPRVITSHSTALVEGRQAFGPYGEAIDLEPHRSGYQPLTGFTGHQQADATGLIYMKGRFYSPAWHRFLNSDQGMDPASVNQFAYVAGSPFHATDPSGLMLNGGGITVEVVDRMPRPPFSFGGLTPSLPFPGGNFGSGIRAFGNNRIDSSHLKPANPNTEEGKVAQEFNDGDYKAGFAQIQALVNQQTIRDLGAANDLMKTQKDSEAAHGYVAAVGRDVVWGALAGGAYWGETLAVIGAVVGFGVGAAPAAGIGSVGGGIVGGVGALSLSAVARGVELQNTLDTIRRNWDANYRAVQNYSDINCVGARPEIRY